MVIAVFLASAVEMVEALTIVLAVGATKGWRAALRGAGLAVLVLAALVGALGPTVLAHVPLAGLRVVVGALLLVFGLQWWRKAVLRSSGLLGKHDEEAIYARQVAELGRPGIEERAGTVVAFKGVLLEGLEVVVIVITLGSASHRLGWAALAACAAAALVGLAGLLVARQLSEVPENAMKTVVGVMLVTFGTFWSLEGLGVHWPGEDLSLLMLAAGYAVVTVLAVLALRHRLRAARAARAVHAGA